MSLATQQTFDPDDDPLGDLEFEFLLDTHGPGTHFAYSYGLSRRGLPELYVALGPEVDEDVPHALVTRAQWLVAMARRLVLGTLREGEVFLSEDGAWRFWAGPREHPHGKLRAALPDAEALVPMLWERAR